MRKIYAAIAAVGASILLLISAALALEYSRVQNLCRSHQPPIETAHDAINAMRNYRADSGVVGQKLAIARQLDGFQSDGYSKDGGWEVKEWNSLIARGYSVAFHRRDAQIEIKCHVLPCGAIDIPNCLTMG
jgi:hypothetical protein